MSRNQLLLISALIAAIIVVVLKNRATSESEPTSLPDGNSPPTITYNGRSIRLTKPYNDFDDYKNDPNNIAAQDLPTAQRLVRTNPVPRRVSSYKELVGATMAVQFPGYGMTTFGGTRKDDGAVIHFTAVEIPQADEDRVIVYRAVGSEYVLVDDFVYSTKESLIASIAMSGNEIC